jgi:thymidine phosphorylase
VGDWVEQGQPLLTIHANDSAKLSGVRQHLLAAYGWSKEPVSAPPLIHRIVS